MKLIRMKRSTRAVLLALSAAACPPAALAAGDDPVLDTVQVRGKTGAPFVEPTAQPRSETTIGREGIANAARAGQSSIYQALDMAPSVSLESLDAYGIARSGPGGGNMRIRGQNSSNLSLSIEGIPLAPPPRFGPREAAFDAENFAAIRLLKGASPVEFGNGWGSSAGSADVALRAPDEERHFQVKQGIGGDRFRRTFLRLDTGAWASGTRAALSYSNASADKWRGAGEAPDKRENVFLDVFQPLADGGSARVFVNHYEYAGNLYRPLSYAQARDIRNFRDYDFNAGLSGTPSRDVAYHDYNRLDERFTLVGGLFSLPLGDGTLRLKPYYAEERLHNLDGLANLVGAPGVRDWRSDKTMYGAIGEYAWKLAGGEIAAGFWGENYEWPAMTRKTYRVAADGSLVYGGWNALYKYDGDYTSRAPYARFELAAGPWTLSGGIKHITWKQPTTLNYVLDPTLPDVSHDRILSSGARVDAESSVGGHTDRAWLPNLGVGYALSPELALYASAGRNFNRAYFGGGQMIGAFQTNPAAFRAAGITAEDLRRSEKLELVDTLDVGARWQRGALSLAPTLFFSRYKDKAVRILDPVANVVYNQPASKATAYGLEIEANWEASQSAQLFAALSWNDATFDADIPLLNGARVAAKGKQLPDTPKRMAKLGASLRWGDFEFVPLLKWIDARYGDVTNTQKISGYAVTDLNLRYAHREPVLGARVSVGLSVVNLFDRRYVSAIAASDDGSTNQATYYPGAPRTVALTLEANF